MKLFKRLALTAAIAAACSSSSLAIGWPDNYQGVMLQGFYWDSYSDTNWSKLENNADTYSKYFSLIWVPNSAKAEGSQTMGYHPVYWFTNHNSSFGTEQRLRSMIQTYKAKGTGIIADVIVNHRSGVSNWTNFPQETWNGYTYQLTPAEICRDDEVANQAGQAKPTGNYDTGEGWNGSRDLDHTSSVVQKHIKDYIRCLLTDFGYAGIRLDFTKGYAPQYTKIYNEANNVTFSVGEYFDGSYDACAAWINGTGKTSAAFDFPFKYQVKKAFEGNNMQELAWTNPSGAYQPAGLIHHDLRRYAVTFIDNHDTYGDQNKFNGDVLAANAFMLCSPGTPCVFLKHYQQYPTQIQTMINIRNGAGVTNTSQVTVHKVDRNVYVATIQGTKGKVGVRIGSGSDVPQGFSGNPVISGTKFAIWSTGSVDPGPGPNPDPTYPSKVYLQGHVNGFNWLPSKGVEAVGTNGVYKFYNVQINAGDEGDYGYYAFSTVTNDSWDVLNESDRYGSTSKDEPTALGQTNNVQLYSGGGEAAGCNSWKIAPGKYNITLDLKNMKMSVSAPTSSVDAIDIEAGAPIYFNMQGVRIANPEAGQIYIVVKDGKASKVVVR